MQSHIEQGRADAITSVEKHSKGLQAQTDARRKQVSRSLQSLLQSYSPAFDLEEQIFALEKKRLAIYKSSSDLDETQAEFDVIDMELSSLIDSRMELKNQRMTIIQSVQ